MCRFHHGPHLIPPPHLVALATPVRISTSGGGQGGRHWAAGHVTINRRTFPGRPRSGGPRGLAQDHDSTRGALGPAGSQIPTPIPTWQTSGCPGQVSPSSEPWLSLLILYLGAGRGALVKSKGGRPRREKQKVPANLGRPGVPSLGDASCNPTCNTNIPPGAGQGLTVPPRGQGLGAHREGPGLGQKMADGEPQEPQEGSRQPGTLHRMRAEASLVAGSPSTCPVPGSKAGTQGSSPLPTLFRAGQQRQEGHIWLTGSSSQDRAFKTGGLL